MTVTVLLYEAATPAWPDRHWESKAFPQYCTESQLPKGQAGTGMQIMDISSQVSLDS